MVWIRKCLVSYLDGKTKYSYALTDKLISVWGFFFFFFFFHLELVLTSESFSIQPSYY